MRIAAYIYYKRAGLHFLEVFLIYNSVGARGVPHDAVYEHIVIEHVLAEKLLEPVAVNVNASTEAVQDAHCTLCRLAVAEDGYARVIRHFAAVSERLHDGGLTGDLAVAVEDITAVLKYLLPRNDCVLFADHIACEVDILHRVRPAEHDLALIYLVKVVCVAELNVGDDIARKSLLARNNMAAAGRVLFVAHADRFTVACFKIQLVGIFYLAYVLRQKGAAAFAVFVAYKETYRFHLLLSCLNIFSGHTALP